MEEEGFVGHGPFGIIEVGTLIPPSDANRIEELLRAAIGAVTVAFFVVMIVNFVKNLVFMTATIPVFSGAFGQASDFGTRFITEKAIQWRLSVEHFEGEQAFS